MAGLPLLTSSPVLRQIALDKDLKNVALPNRGNGIRVVLSLFPKKLTQTGDCSRHTCVCIFEVRISIGHSAMPLAISNDLKN